MVEMKVVGGFLRQDLIPFELDLQEKNTQRLATFHLIKSLPDSKMIFNICL